MAAALRILSKGKLIAVQPSLRQVINRASPVLLSRGISVSSARAAPIPTDAEQVTGVEKKELDAISAGIEDPFNLTPYEGPLGTKENPVEVLSLFDDRIIGCLCEPDATCIIWKKIYLNQPTRCACGGWFVLRRGNPINIPQDIPLDQIGHHHH